MAKRPAFRLNRKGVAAALHQMGPTVTAKAEEIAAQIRQSHPDLDVNVQRYSTDRAAASVMVRDSQARALQAREGLITKAAAKVGLEVRTR